MAEQRVVVPDPFLADLGGGGIFTEGVRLPDARRFPRYEGFLRGLLPVLHDDLVLRMALREACLRDRYILARLCGYDDPDHPWDELHLWMVTERIPQMRAVPGLMSAWFCPRGTYKTALEEVDILFSILNSPSRTFGVGSWELAVAERIVRSVRQKLELPVMGWLFPDIIPGPKERGRRFKWTDGALTVRRGGTGTKDDTLSAFSLKSPATSQHFDRVYLDDVVEAENSATADSIESVKRRMRDVRSLRTGPASQIEVRGTLWDPEDWHCTAVIGNPNWVVERHPAIVEDPDRVLDAAPHPFGYPPGAPAFPRCKPLEQLKVDLQEMTEYHFSGQMLMRLHDVGGAEWPEPCRYYREGELSPPFTAYTFVDLASDQKDVQKADDCVVALVLAMPPAGKMDGHDLWLWDGAAGRLSWTDVALRVFDNYERWGAHAIIEEIGAFAAFEATMQEVARMKGFMVPHIAVKHRSAGTGGRVKERIRALDPFFRAGRVLSRDPKSISPSDKERLEFFMKYEHQKRRWPRVHHDDILDALADAAVYAVPPAAEVGGDERRVYRRRRRARA